MRWHPHYEVWLLILVVMGAYLWAIRRRGDGAATRGQVTAFTLGMVAMWVAADWPVHELAETRLYSVHMVQHLLLTFVTPPLLLMGTPAWMARALLRPAFVLRWVRRLSRPLVALLLFNLVIALSHWPAVVEATVGSEVAHFGAHVVLFGTALLMWMPVLSPVLEIPRLPFPGQMMYLFAQSILPTIPASFLTFGDTPLYPSYAAFPRIWGIDVMTDQRIAGLFMKIVGGLILWSIIATIFFRWHHQETRDGSDALAWRDVERELSKAAR